MTTESKPRLKITYATLRADNEELHALYEAGLTEAKRQLDGHHRNFVGGSERVGDGETTVTSPIDRNLVLGHFARGTRQDVREFLQLAADVPLQTEIRLFDLEQANQALQALKKSQITGAGVLRIAPS